MQQISLTAPDISCNHCKHTIGSEFGTPSGVESVSVVVPSKHVTVSIDPKKTSEVAISARLDETRYSATV